jgi:hypothetical protein
MNQVIKLGSKFVQWLFKFDDPFYSSSLWERFKYRVGVLIRIAIVLGLIYMATAIITRVLAALFF